MNRMKEAAAELESYLGNDSHGLKLLERLVREANDIRKAFVSSQDALSRREEQWKSLLAQRTQLKHKEEELTEELRKANERIRQLGVMVADKQKEVNELEAVLDPPIPVSSEHRLSNRARFKSLFKALRKQMPIPPEPSIRARKHSQYYFELTDLVTDYKQEQYTLIGMFVVVCCVMRFPVAFVMEEELDAFGAKEWEGGESGKFLRWIKTNWIKTNSVWQEMIAEKYFRHLNHKTEIARPSE